MSRVRSALLVVLLLLAGTAAPAVGGVTPPGSGPEATRPIQGLSTNTTNVLALDAIERSDSTTPGLSVTKSVAADASALESRFDAYAVEQRYLAASSAAARRQILVNATRRFAARVDALRARERSVRRAYLAGEVSSGAYLATLGKLDAAADGIESALNRIAALPGRDSDIESRIRNIKAELATLQGPVRDRAAAAIRGEQTGRLFVAASRSGAVLALVDANEGVYVREAVRYDNFDRVGNAVGIAAARERFDTVYPWATNRENWRRFSIGFFGPDAYLLQIEHEHGTLTSYLDASTTHVYREIQVKTLETLPIENVRTVSRAGVTVATSNAYPGGPLRVRVTNATGAPLDARVIVNGTAVGRTGDDGVRWAVSPDGTYPVTVTHDSTTIELNVTAAYEG